MIVEIVNTHKTRTVNSKNVRKLIQLIVRHEASIPLKYLSVVFTHTTGIRKISRRFLNHNYTTDVISFDLSDSTAVDGEIYVSLDAAASQAREFGVPYSNEVLRLAAHGLLHLLGYDDRFLRQRKKMLTLGDRYIAMLK